MKKMNARIDRDCVLNSIIGSPVILDKYQYDPVILGDDKVNDDVNRDMIMNGILAGGTGHRRNADKGSYGIRIQLAVDPVVHAEG